MWDDDAWETAIGVLNEDEEAWDLVVLVESVGTDLVRGRLSFRRGTERFDTAAVVVEESAEAVVRRATQLPESMLRQLLHSARE